jgi:hypothetical protein
MDNADLAKLTSEQIRALLLQDENPFGELTKERYRELAALGIRDPFGYLTDEEWYERALRHVDPQEAAFIIGDLDTVNWHELNHMFGTAEDVPRLLRGLLAEDYLSANVVWELLTEKLLHQGTVERATLVILPYFFRLLASDEELFQFMALSFLCALAEAGRSEMKFQEERLWGEIWAVLTTALPTVEPLLDSPDPNIQSLATLYDATLTGTADDE